MRRTRRQTHLKLQLRESNNTVMHINTCIHMHSLNSVNMWPVYTCMYIICVEGKIGPCFSFNIHILLIYSVDMFSVSGISTHIRHNNMPGAVTVAYTFRKEIQSLILLQNTAGFALHIPYKGSRQYLCIFLKDCLTCTCTYTHILMYT